MNKDYNRLKTASKLKNWLACNYTTINQINEKELKKKESSITEETRKKRGDQFEEKIYKKLIKKYPKHIKIKNDENRLEKTKEARLEDRIERIEEAISERIGKLSHEQKQIVSTYATQFIPTGEEWLKYRRDIQNAARKLFVTRSFNNNFETDLIELMQNPDSYKSDIYKQSSAHNMTVTATLISEVFSTLSRKQREALIENIDELIETVEDFKG